MSYFRADLKVFLSRKNDVASAGRCSGDLSELLAFGSGLFGFFDCGESHVLGSDTYANFLQESEWRRTAGEDPNEIVLDLLVGPRDIENDGLRFEFDGIGIEH